MGAWVAPGEAGAGIVIVLDGECPGMEIKIAKPIGKIRVPWLLLVTPRVIIHGSIDIPPAIDPVATIEAGRLFPVSRVWRIRYGIFRCHIIIDPTVYVP